MIQNTAKILLLLPLILGLMACTSTLTENDVASISETESEAEPSRDAQEAISTVSTVAKPTVASETTTSPTLIDTATIAPNPIPPEPRSNTSVEITEIASIPDIFPANIRNTFDRYTQVIPQNGKPINIYAQSRISTVQIIQARSTLVFWLTDIPGSVYGADKSAVANQMGNNKAVLMLLNGSDGDENPPEIDGQPLYETELVVPGSAAYIHNDYEQHRDATFEEILHLVHDTGIGVDGENAQLGALPAFQAEIRKATNHAIGNNFQIWPTTAAEGGEERGWFNELEAENSLSQEYLAAVIDSYYGLWGPFQEANAGMWGFYIAQTRADIETKDPMGAALMEQFFSPYLTYNAQLDPSFNGTFLMTFDPQTPYTHKSQYLLDATLTGDNHANLTGNSQANRLAGNDGNNMLDGMSGDDTAVYLRPQSEYIITHNSDSSVTVIGDGTDTLVNIEKIAFKDGLISADDLLAISESPIIDSAVVEPAPAIVDPTAIPSQPITADQLAPMTNVEFETIMMQYLQVTSLDALYDHFDNLNEEQLLGLVKTAIGLKTEKDADALLENLFGGEDDDE
ncbi:MAG: hypothetical protein ACI9EW_003683 [Cellvibrionaceae bacterium]|jgi:hypothetical protein